MSERPIIFSTDMVKAILEGRKTQTRRVIKIPQKYQTEVTSMASGDIAFLSFREKIVYEGGYYWSDFHSVYCPYGQVGDRLWVREVWATSKRLDKFSPSYIGNAGTVPLWYVTNDSQIDNPAEVRGKWRPSIYMPRWASRMTLEITEVRVERLQEIMEEDAVKEGFISPWADSKFINYWDSINDKGSPFKEHPFAWHRNPWVWTISFKKI